MQEALASEVVDQAKYELVQGFILDNFEGSDLMQGYLILRVLAAQLERLLGIPHVEVNIEEGEE
jgi:hypothetical protein